MVAPKISVNADIGLNVKEVVSAKVNGDIGWLQDKIGLGAKLPLSPWESLRVLGYHQSVVDELKKYDEWGIHMKMGVLYAVVIAAVLVYGVAMGVYDVQTGFQYFQHYWESLGKCI